jgi:hypothetical protein
MKTLFFVFLGCFFAFSAATAQADHRLDAKTVRNDSVILQSIIMPAIQTSGQQSQVPDWKALRATIVGRYDDSYGDRNVTKAKIYYFYATDWAQFSTAIVEYTQKYEFKDSLSLMNMNAKMILQHSESPAEWKAAQSWAKYASDRNPSNDDYKATYEALSTKLKGQ